jgi:hypothetical protein
MLQDVHRFASEIFTMQRELRKSINEMIEDLEDADVQAMM